MENINWKRIFEIIFDYFKAVFAFWYPEETAELEGFIDSFKPDAE